MRTAGSGAAHRRLGAAALFLGLAVLASACVAGGRSAVMRGPFGVFGWDHHFGAYQDRAPHKAFALAPGRGVWPLGRSSGYDTEAGAVDRALRACREARQLAKTRFGREPDAPCRLYAVDDLIVWDFAPPSVADARRCLAQPAVQAYVEALRETIGWSWSRFDIGPHDGVLLELELTREGDIGALRTLEATSPAAAEEAHDAVRDARPFVPLFGDLGCAAGIPIPLRFGEPLQST